MGLSKDLLQKKPIFCGKMRYYPPEAPKNRGLAGRVEGEGPARTLLPRAKLALSFPKKSSRNRKIETKKCGTHSWTFFCNGSRPIPGFSRHGKRETTSFSWN